MNIKQINFISFLIVILVTCGVTFLNLYPNHYKKTHTPDGKWFTGQASWFDPWDVNIYASAIGYGKSGSLTYFNLYDSETGQPVPIYHIYTLIGYISGKMGFSETSNLDLFFYSTYFTNILLSITIWIFLGLFFKERKHKWVALAFALIGGGLGFLLFPNTMLPDISHPGFTMLNALTKPHRAISSSLFLISVFYFYKSHEIKSQKFLLYGFLSTVLLLFFHPHKILLLGLLFAFISIQKKDYFKTLPTVSIAFIIYFLLVGRTLLSNTSLSGLSSQNTGEMANPVFVILGFGVLFPFILFEIFHKKDNEKIRFVSAWLIFQLILIYLPFKFQRELIQGIWIPATILATYGIKDFCKKTQLSFIQLSILTILISSASFFLIFQKRITAANDNPWIYLSNDEAIVLNYIKDNKLKGGILAQYKISNMIPAITQNPIYVGHGYQSPNSEYRSKKADDFFTGEMTSKDANEFMEKANLKYVFLEENELPQSYLEFLTPLIQKGEITLYERK